MKFVILFLIVSVVIAFFVARHVKYRKLLQEAEMDPVKSIIRFKNGSIFLLHPLHHYVICGKTGHVFGHDSFAWCHAFPGFMDLRACAAGELFWHRWIENRDKERLEEVKKLLED